MEAYLEDRERAEEATGIELLGDVHDLRLGRLLQIVHRIVTRRAVTPPDYLPTSEVEGTTACSE